MFTLTVIQSGSGKQASEQATRAQILVDHLEASAGRQGFTVDHVNSNSDGWILRDGKRVGRWMIGHHNK